MKEIKPLGYNFLRKTLSISELHFKTTEEIKLLTKFFGQTRALQALNFGIGIKYKGYNIYAMGPTGIGKRYLIRKILKKYTSSCPIPPDWCYIHNFEHPEKPIALSLPAGYGFIFQNDMKSFTHELRKSILSIFESDEYRSRMEKINHAFNIKRNKIFKKYNSDIKNIKTPKLYKEQHEKEYALQIRLTTTVVKPLIYKLKMKYKKLTSVLKYLRAVQKDVINNVNELIKQDEMTHLFTFTMDNLALIKYKVNLLVDNRKLKGAPYYFEANPNYSNLISRIEHINQLGNSVTNFTLIKPGCLHKANRGYLILEARKLKKNRDAWEALKSALYTRKIKIETQDHESDVIKPLSLEPMPIPLDIKIILVGDRNTYYSFCQHDQDFTELFKVVVDFDDQINRNKKNIKLYSLLIGSIIKREKLIPFHASAVAALIDHSTRLTEDNEKLTTHIRQIYDLILESNYLASLKKRKIVIANDVISAIKFQCRRMDRTKSLYYEDILREFIVINTSGKAIGQVNCLSVRKVGNYSYGHPTRVTARIRLGRGKIIDIQREIKMAGPMHSKAGLIISNFLASRFNQGQHFALSASLAFEQLYCWTDGDSASVGELCALLSALAEIPIYQFLAITGSIDQYGVIQAVGGLNEKIEGFFDICKAKGLTGKQGVLIPKVNRKNLMLREDVVKAAKANKFFIYAIETIDEAITLLTGWPAGKRNRNGEFSENSIYYKIEMRLKEFSRNNTCIHKDT